VARDFKLSMSDSKSMILSRIVFGNDREKSISNTCLTNTDSTTDSDDELLLPQHRAFVWRDDFLYFVPYDLFPFLRIRNVHPYKKSCEFTCIL
jgi:hypothetical protein